MRKLIGQIFRDENGVETIERMEPGYKVLWKIGTEEDFSSDYPYRLTLTCPKCGLKQMSRFDTQRGRDWYLDTLKSKSINNRTYCGYCGAHNILQGHLHGKYDLFQHSM